MEFFIGFVLIVFTTLTFLPWIDIDAAVRLQMWIEDLERRFREDSE